jgi:Peptidase family M1 domain
MRIPKATLRPLLAAPLLSAAFCLVWAARPAPHVVRAAPGPDTTTAANSDPTYQQLRHLGLGTEAFSVHEVVLKRDAGTFTFHSGTVCFVAPVAGKITGAVFAGDGGFTLAPPIPSERHSLSLLTRGPGMDERYDELVLRFTDDTYAELKAAKGASPAAGASCRGGPLEDSQHVTRRDLNYNLEARIVQDLLGQHSGGLFVAFIKGKKYSSKMIYFIDPHGVPRGLEPEEVALFTYDESKLGEWAVFHFSREYAAGQATGNQKNGVMRVKAQKLDTVMESSGKLNGKAATTFVSNVDGLRAIHLQLFPTLRVDKVTAEDNQPLSFIQEDKKEDSQFWVILPKALAAGQEYTITSSYSGSDAVSNEGGGNYYPVARSSWYPAGERWDDFPTFDMTFSIPKGMELVATGQQLSNVNEGKQAVSHWRSEAPQPVAGFQFGKFKEQDATLAKLDNFKVEALANQEVPGMVQSFLGADALPGSHSTGAPVGTMETTGLAKKALAEAEIAVQIYSDYFGPLQFKRLAMTQQTAMNYGQSWPEMVFLPMSYFYDTTIRHQLGMDDPRGYFKVVAPHEVAHQWWGHTVAWGSYRDQWMSEGFADFSASLFIQLVWRDKPQEFQKFWNDERDLLTEKNKEGFRAIDVGPLTMGYRLNNSRAGFNITRQLIYPKGAYILHMLRMMMWDRKTKDEDFKNMMRDFVKTYSGRSATTEDFKATVERHITPALNVDGNGKMDWFFNEYVYGTALPTYTFEGFFDKGPNDVIQAHLKLAQSKVDDNFRMLVPIYVELADGRTVFFGRAKISGNSTWEQIVPIPGLKDMPKRALINQYNDVLCAK